MVEKESVIDGCVNTKVRKEWVGEDNSAQVWERDLKVDIHGRC